MQAAIVRAFVGAPGRCLVYASEREGSRDSVVSKFKFFVLEFQLIFTIYLSNCTNLFIISVLNYALLIMRYTIARVRIRVRTRARTRFRTRVKDSIKKSENTGNCHYPTFLFHKFNTPRFDNYANHLA